MSSTKVMTGEMIDCNLKPGGGSWRRVPRMGALEDGLIMARLGTRMTDFLMIEYYQDG